MKRCKHSRVTIFEDSITPLEFHYEEGVLVFDYAHNSNPTGRFAVECKDCGLSKNYTLKTLPKWVEKLLSGVR